MAYLQDIVEIEQRIKALNLSVRAACLRAGVQHGAWWRWSSEEANPTLRSFSTAIAKMKGFLDAEEARLRAHLDRIEQERVA